MTITEALAELKTLSKRIQSKRQSINQYLFRVESFKDPMEKDGGSAKFIEQELQAISDLEKRVLELRRGIAKANDETKINLEGVEQSISDWLIWRREVAPDKENFLKSIRANLNSIRENARRQGSALVANGQADKPSDIVVNFNEKELAADIEKMANILGQLDGQLSLKNATVLIQ